MLALNVDTLDETATNAMLQHLLGPDISPGLMSDLFARSGGNPFFLEELATLMRSKPDGRGSESLELPSSLQGLVSARLDGLPLIEREILEDASVLGRRGPAVALRRLAEVRGHTSIGDSLSALAEKDLLVITRVDTGDWSFRSDVVRDVVYGRLTKSERARRHFRIAEFVKAGGAGERSPDAVAFHLRRSAELVREIGRISGVPDGVRDDALVWLRAAALAASGSSTPDVALRLYSQALGLLNETENELRVDLLLSRARAGVDARHLTGARADVAQAGRLAREHGFEHLAARGQLYMGEIEQVSANYEISIELLTDAIGRFRELGAAAGEAEGLRNLGMTYLVAGRLDEAERCIDDALAIFTRKARKPARPGRARTWPGSPSCGECSPRPKRVLELRSSCLNCSATRWASAGPAACWPTYGCTKADSLKPKSWPRRPCGQRVRAR